MGSGVVFRKNSQANKGSRGRFRQAGVISNGTDYNTEGNVTHGNDSSHRGPGE